MHPIINKSVGIIYIDSFNVDLLMSREVEIFSHCVYTIDNFTVPYELYQCPFSSSLTFRFAICMCALLTSQLGPKKNSCVYRTPWLKKVGSIGRQQLFFTPPRFYTSTKSMRVFIFTAACLCECMSVCQ